MRQFVLGFALLCLSACGNSNAGKAFTPYNYQTTSAQTAVSGGTTAASNAQPLYCRSPILADANLTAAFSGSVLCPLQATNAAVGTKGGGVLLRVNDNVPANTAVCLIPFVNDSATTETCFTITTQASVTLTTDQYTSVVLVPQANLAAYKLFLATPGSLPPARVVYSM